MFEILNGYENIYSNIFLSKIKAGKRTRGPDLTLVKEQSRLDVERILFSQRTIDVWNQLFTGTDCVHASSINMLEQNEEIPCKGGLYLE